jgi:hypothetical protein
MIFIQLYLIKTDGLIEKDSEITVALRDKNH